MKCCIAGTKKSTDFYRFNLGIVPELILPLWMILQLSVLWTLIKINLCQMDNHFKSFKIGSFSWIAKSTVIGSYLMIQNWYNATCDILFQGRNPFFLEPALVIAITDGHKLTNNNGVQDEVRKRPIPTLARKPAPLGRRDKEIPVSFLTIFIVNVIKSCLTLIWYSVIQASSFYGMVSSIYMREA